MANTAIALQITSQGIEDQNIKLSLTALYYDTVTQVLIERAVYALFSPTATPGQIETAIANAVVQQGKDGVPSIILQRNDVLMLDIKRAV